MLEADPSLLKFQLEPDIAVMVQDIHDDTVAGPIELARRGAHAVLRLTDKAHYERPLQINLEVQGHTDNVGGDAYNMKLSQARAEAVRTYLATRGIAASRLVAKGYGFHQPIVPNTAAVCPVILRTASSRLNRPRSRA